MNYLLSHLHITMAKLPTLHFLQLLYLISVLCIPYATKWCFYYYFWVKTTLLPIDHDIVLILPPKNYKHYKINAFLILAKANIQPYLCIVFLLSLPACFKFWSTLSFEIVTRLWDNFVCFQICRVLSRFCAVAVETQWVSLRNTIWD